MDISIQCSKCGKNYRVSSQWTGKRVKCKRCGGVFDVNESPLDSADEIVVDPVAETGDKLPTNLPIARPVPTQGTSVPLATPLPSGDFDPLDIPLSSEGMADEEFPTLSHYQSPLSSHPSIVPGSATPEAPTSVWQKAGASHRTLVPAGTSTVLSLRGLEHCLILLGGLLLLIGLLSLILTIGGTPFARMEGAETVGMLVALIMGLIGVAVLATGLRRLKTISLVSAGVGAMLTFILFGVALVVQTGGDSAFQKVAGLRHNAWLKHYPEWKTTMSELTSVGPGQVGVRVSDIWPQEPLTEIGASAKFPTDQPISRQPGKQDLGDETIDVSIYRHSFKTDHGEVLLAVRYFEASEDALTQAELLEKFEKGLKKNLLVKDYRTEPTTIDGFPGLESSYVASSASGEIGVHNRLVVRGRSVYLVFASGPVGTIPGAESRKFLRSFKLDRNWRDPKQVNVGPSDSGLDSSNPVQESDGTRGNDNAGPGLRNESDAFFSTPAGEQKHETAVSMRRRKLEQLMDELMGLRIRLTFPQSYLGEAVGQESSNRQYFTHPDKQPIIGIDVSLSTRGSEQAIRLVGPIFDQRATNERTIFARNGYGLAGLSAFVRERIPGEQHIVGLQFIFMKITDRGFDITDKYTSKWIGQAPIEGTGDTIESDGRPVYGLWLRSGTTLNSIGLIIEPDY